MARGIGAHLGVDQLGVAGGGAHRQRVDFEPVAVGEREHLDQAHRILGEEIVVGQGEPAAVEHEAFELARPAAEGRQAEAARRAAANFSSRWARNTPVRSPTVFACRK